MEDLIGWLGDAIADDERLAKEQQAFDEWVEAQRGDNVDSVLVPPLTQLGAPGDPARVLAEVAAKRRILDHIEHELADKGGDNPYWYGDKLTPILCMLALPYADRNGYRDEWRS